MNDNTIVERKKKIIKRKKLYFVLGWPLIVIGMALFLYERAFTLSLIFIISGVVMRLLYYYITIELKSLDRYEQLLNKTKLLIFLGFVLFSFSDSVYGQLEEGDDSPELTNLEWISGNPVKILEDNDNPKIFVIEFWAPWDKASLLTLPLLSKIHQEYSEDGICVIAIAKEKKNRLNTTMNSIDKKMGFRIAVDDKGEVTKKYLGEGSGIPKAFVIGKNKQVIWAGNPIVLQSVIKKILKGDFDADVQKEINLLQIKLQNKMQMNKTQEAINLADKILELEPSNEVALRVRLFIFERFGKLNDAITFIQGQIDKKPDEAKLYFIKLDILERTGSSLEKRKKVCEEVFEKFKSNPEVLERLAWTAAARMEFGSAPLSIALKASENAVAMLIKSKKQNPAKLSNYLETQARLYYAIGKIAKAVEEQEKVIRLRKGDPSEKKATEILEYYKEALKLKMGN